MWEGWLYRDSNSIWMILGLLIGLFIALIFYASWRLFFAQKARRITNGTRQEQNADNGQRDKELHEGMSSLPDAIIVLRDNLEIEWCNTTATEWFDLDTVQYRQTTLPRLFNDQALVDYITGGRYTESFDCVAPGNRQISIRIRIAPYRDGLLLLQARNVTQIKQLEQIRRDFVSNASHELRTPISVLYGYLEMMKDEGEKTIDKQWRHAIDQMYKQTERIKKIVDDMMILSRLEAAVPKEQHEYIDIVGLLESACYNTKILSGKKRHRFETQIDPNFALYGNHKEIESLVANLLSNAVRYTPKKGTITVSWEIDLLGATLSVSDTGIGIESEEIPRLTERFYRIDSGRSRETGGTGLGLAIVNHIVTRHDADLIIDSEVGKGSRFNVHFPKDRIKNNNEQVNLLLN